MKIFSILTVATTLLATSQGFVLEMFPNSNCGGTAVRRNVYDNTCAYTKDFKSFRVKKHGGSFQQFKMYKSQTCAGSDGFTGCAAGIRKAGIDVCHNVSGTAKAISSYSNGAFCPN
jgi:hypothetical protein